MSFTVTVESNPSYLFKCHRKITSSSLLPRRETMESKVADVVEESWQGHVTFEFFNMTSYD